MKKIYTICLALVSTIVAFGQPINPGNFEMRLVEASGPTEIVLEMRKIMPVPTIFSGPGSCFVPGLNSTMTDLTFTVTYDPGVVSAVGVTVNIPCSLGGVVTPYGVLVAGGALPGGDGMQQGFAAGNFTPYPFPEEWIIDTWTQVCTLNVTAVAPPSQAGANPPLLIRIVNFGETGAQFDPNIGVDLVDYTPTVEQVVPLDLLDFKADKKGERSAILNWTTVNEINSSHFEIERSSDLENWEHIGSVDAAGESSDVIQYTYLDQDVYDGRRPNARFYYRLRMVDVDNSYKFTQIDIVRFDKGGLSGSSVFAFPNPSTKGLNVEFDVTGEGVAAAQMTMINALGQIVYSREIPEGSEIEYIDYSRTNIGTGSYILRVVDVEKNILDQIKVIVQDN